ncbi:MAG: hypothetical protein H6983_22010 [Ectothiorhodospiraceae bacterium]|nr:hypothetical protein [Ectothiorhodospiraceae bacterium]
MDESVTALLPRLLGRPRGGAAVGVPGAIAEFTCVEGEPVAAEAGGATWHSLRTARGAARVDVDGARPLAWQAPAGRDHWLTGLAFCLPTTLAVSAPRTVLTELGPDHDALDPARRDDVRFDLGLGIDHVEMSVRSGDPEVVGALRAACGVPVLAADSPAMAVIKAASPHRILTSRLARVEVYQPIPSRSRGERTPPGPHTHLLPFLLAHRRSHAPELPVPPGHRACFELFLVDDDAAELAPALLRRHGSPAFDDEARRASRALRRGLRPDDYPAPRSALRERALRVTLRQQATARTGDTELVASWRARFDPPPRRLPGH